MSPEPVSVYGMSTSGNCHKVRLLLEQLGRPYDWVEIDSANGATRTPDGAFEFLALPNGGLTVTQDGVLAGESGFAGWVSFNTHGGMLSVRLEAPVVRA